MDYTLQIIDPIDDPGDDNCDVQVVFPDGRAYVTTFITPRNVTTLMRRWAATGEHGGGHHFAAPDTIIVERLDESTIRAVIDSILDEQEGRLTPQFTPALGAENLDTRAVDAFVDAAREFCQVIEQHHDLRDENFLIVSRPRDILRIILPRLAALYAAGLALRDVRVDDANELIEGMRDTQLRSTYDGLVTLLGNYRYYRAAVPLADAGDHRRDNNVHMGDLVDDLADIYRDVRAGLDAWDAAESERRPQAIRFWSLHFDSHYSQHLVDAMAAIQQIVSRA